MTQTGVDQCLCDVNCVSNYGYNPWLKGTDYDTNDFRSQNFDTMFNAFVVLFHQMVVNNWFIVADACVNVMESAWPLLYFVSFNITCVAVVQNILVSIILESFHKVHDRVLHDNERMKAIKIQRKESVKRLSTLAAGGGQNQTTLPSRQPHQDEVEGMIPNTCVLTNGTRAKFTMKWNFDTLRESLVAAQALSAAELPPQVLLRKEQSLLKELFEVQEALDRVQTREVEVARSDTFRLTTLPSIASLGDLAGLDEEDDDYDSVFARYNSNYAGGEDGASSPGGIEMQVGGNPLWPSQYPHSLTASRRLQASGTTNNLTSGAGDNI